MQAERAVPSSSSTQQQADDWRAGYQSPAVSLPKGGGAIKGIGEKFAANPVTGTGSMSVPITTSPGRSGFGPQLSLSYDSGAGNGPFGFGWSLALPSITRKTDKGLPQYLDWEESDVFVLSGAEDLVPVLQADGQRHADTASAPGYLIHRYRPRIEGLFARIERWTELATGDMHWRSISKDNILSVYGRTAESRIADPLDKTRIFTWLICETRDDKGNCIVYTYKAEDGTGVDTGLASERNRGAADDRNRTAQRYLKRIQYGNRTPLLIDGKRPGELPAAAAGDWMFEVVFDYGDHPGDAPTPVASAPWIFRVDPFSSHRSGFEVRTTRLCQRVLMFHHFEGEPGVGRDCLVRSTDFLYSDEVGPPNPRHAVYTFLKSATQTGYRRQGAGYVARSLPPVEFGYTEARVQSAVQDVPPEALQNLPAGVDDSTYQWIDLHGEGIPGILTEQAGAWFYKHNLSPLDEGQTVRLGPLEQVSVKPNTSLAAGAQFMDLAGDGLPDLVMLDGPMPGLYEHDEAEGWQPFRPLTSRVNRPMRDPNLRMLDLDGDGHADLLISEDNAFVIHLSLGEAGFGAARRIAQVLDEEKGPRLVFAEVLQTIFLADMSGDGLTDLVRIRNGEVCYWPHLGHGRFGAKVTMDNAPWFDNPDQFDPKRLRLADIDGSGTTDLIYLHRDGVRLYFNQCGNGWSAPQLLAVFPRIDDLVHISTADLLGNGTACLVWSSPFPGDAQRSMRYVNLMGNAKPHLLVRSINNLGAETRVTYAPSTRFYLQDKQAGRPWITRLPFPVHVVEQVETFDHLSRNRFVTRYAYHHGYFDGEEREFRGFGMVEQWDTEQFSTLAPSGGEGWGEGATNIDAASHAPPVLTRTWFHTGIYLGRDHVSDFFAGLLDANDKGEYFREPGLSDAQARALLLPDTVLPEGLTLAEEREACRALKGSMLRQEVYALDGSAKEPIPYSVAEQNFSMRCLQPAGEQRHAVFFTHAREVLTYHYERNPADPRIQHALTLAVDDFGNVLREVAIGYGRRQPDASLPTDIDRRKQTGVLVTLTENQVTAAIDEAADHRTPLPWESKTWELTGFRPRAGNRFGFDEWAAADLSDRVTPPIPYHEVAPDDAQPRKRLIEQARTRYRRNDLSGLCPFGAVESLALPGEACKLAFTPDWLTQIYQRDGQPLLADLAQVLGGTGADQGGYVDLLGDGCWWLPSGRVHLSPDATHSAAQELAWAQQHFFLPQRHVDPFGASSVVEFDRHDLLVQQSTDAIGNRVSVEANDYRTLQPRRLRDPNGNRTEVAFDALGLVVGSAVMGKPGEAVGDTLAGFDPDPSEADLLAHLADPFTDPQALLGRATTRVVYDLHAFHRSGAAPVACTLARETHDADLLPREFTKIQHSFSYSDGFGREIQKKIQAEPGPVPRRDAARKLMLGPDGAPRMTEAPVSPRWVGSGWTVFNNKGKPVRQYEPFFSATHHFEPEQRIGVSPILCYDPLQRVAATLHPNHTFEKVVFDAWSQTTWDVNDNVLSRPDQDADVAGFAQRLPERDILPTWHALRTDPDLDTKAAELWPNADQRRAEREAAVKAAAHAGTPTCAYFDTLGRPFLTLAHNRVRCSNHALDGQEENFATRVELDIEGNQREVIDALGRVVMRYAYDLLGNRVHQFSMEAGARWMLNDVTGKPIRAWDSRQHQFRTEYDPLRRPLRTFVTNAEPNPQPPEREWLTERIVYGEQHPDAETLNLRGRPCLHLDQAGVVSTEAHDFKGNPLRGSRRVALDYKRTLDWRTVDAALPPDARVRFNADLLERALAPQIDPRRYSSATTFDALNRPLTLRSPDNSLTRHRYNEANLLDGVEVNLQGQTANGRPVWTPFVTNIDYDAKGQRQRIDYGNGASTDYAYDPLTLRLTHLLTRRHPASFPDDNPRPARSDWPGSQVQNLRYAYDPAGNITHIQDDAQQRIYFSNQRIDPSNDYVYDAVYRLIEATGREHLGQGGEMLPHSHDDAGRIRQQHPNSGDLMARYCEKYVYDAVGNFLTMSHHRSCADAPGWVRSYAYIEPSLLEPGMLSNRLSGTTIGAQPETYSDRANGFDGYDAHGNMRRMPHLGGGQPGANMHWDYKDQFRQADLGGGGTAFYVYDAAGQRLRKVVEKNNGHLIEERIYLGGFEIFRRHSGPIGADTATLERETLHVMDDKQRIALVETRTLPNTPDPDDPLQLIRYQFGNHLGSSSLELDEQAQIISYEEYAPYGSSTYQAVRSQEETAKRYRYIEKERDDESGIYYCDARYYSPYLCRWLACDPAGLIDGVNILCYVNNNPVLYIDATGLEQGNPGVLQDIVYTKYSICAKYEATPGTWTSATTKQEGLAEKYPLDRGFGAYSNTVKNPDESSFENPDELEVGQKFLVCKPIRTLPSDFEKFTDDELREAYYSDFHITGSDKYKELNSIMNILYKDPTGVALDNTLLRLAELRGRNVDVIRDEYKLFMSLRAEAKQRGGNVDKLEDLDFMGKMSQLRFGKVVGDKLGIDPVFGALLNPTGGMVGPGDTEANKSNPNAGVADWVLQPLKYLRDSATSWGVPDNDSRIGWHGVFHDAGGYLRKYHGIGPGYTYRDGFSAGKSENPYSGQDNVFRFWNYLMMPN